MLRQRAGSVGERLSRRREKRADAFLAKRRRAIAGPGPAADAVTVAWFSVCFREARRCFPLLVSCSWPLSLYL